MPTHLRLAPSTELAVGDGNVAAGNGRGLAVATVLEGLVSVVDDLDAFVGAHPEVTILVLHEGCDSVGGEFASIVRVHLGHAAVAVVDIDNVGASAEPFETGEAVADEFVDLGSGDHRHGGKIFPGAVGASDGEGMGAVGVKHPEVALAVESHSAGVEAAVGTGGVGYEGTASGGAVVESLHLIVTYGGESVAPDGCHQFVGVARVDSHVDKVEGSFEKAVALVEGSPLASHRGEEVGWEIGIGIGGGVASRTEHHAVVEGDKAIGIVGRKGTVGTVVFLRTVGVQANNALPRVCHPKGVVTVVDGIKGIEGTPMVDVLVAIIVQSGIESHHSAVATNSEVIIGHMD